MLRLIVGCGYLGSRVARRWLEAGDKVFVVTRSPERAATLAAEGYRPLVADVTEPATLGGWPAADTVLYAVGYDRQSAKPIEQVHVEGLRNVLAALAATTGRFIYVSSTGVYGDRGGEWIDETTPCEPERPGGRACLAAERILASHALAAKSVVLRLAGIYGPGRIPRKTALVAAESIAAPRDGYLNLIHVNDAAQTVLAAAERPIVQPRIYLVADGNPVSREAYYTELARLVGAPPPRFARPPADSAAAERATADKRVRNRRMLEELAIRLQYPSYREGLAAILAT